MSDLYEVNLLALLTNGEVRSFTSKDEIIKYLIKKNEISKNFSVLDNCNCIELNTSSDLNIKNFYDDFANKKDFFLTELNNHKSILNKVLSNIAELIDVLYENGYLLYYFDLKKIFYTDEGKLLLNNDYLLSSTTNEQIIPLNKLILDEFDFFINPQISKKRKIELVDFDYNLGIYSFFSIIYFMVIEEKELKHFKRKIDYLKMRILLNSDYRIFKFLELNLKNSQNQKNLKAQKLFNEFKKKINNSPFNKTPKNKFNIQIGFDSIHGIHKKGNINQDSYYHIKISDDKLLFMVADGVSTADIGSGDIISKRIQEYLSKNEEEIKNDINEILNKNIELSNCFKEYINKLIKNINASLEAIINDYLSEKNKNDEHVMSSTIIIGFIYDNLMITAHLGDSELLFIRDSEVTQLLTPHIGAIKEFRNISIQIDKGIFQGFVDVNKIVSLKEITNALPVGDIKNGKFFVDNNLHIENNIFYLKEKDIILVTTDGLSDSIENSGKELENYLNDFFKNEKTINRKVIRNLLNSVDSDGGIDDITVIGLLINSQKNSRLK